MHKQHNKYTTEWSENRKSRFSIRYHWFLFPIFSFFVVQEGDQITFLEGLRLLWRLPYRSFPIVTCKFCDYFVTSFLGLFSVTRLYLLYYQASKQQLGDVFEAKFAFQRISKLMSLMT